LRGREIGQGKGKQKKGRLDAQAIFCRRRHQPRRAPVAGAGWLHEIKRDGLRIVARKNWRAGEALSCTTTVKLEPVPSVRQRQKAFSPRKFGSEKISDDGSQVDFLDNRWLCPKKRALRSAR